MTIETLDVALDLLLLSLLIFAVALVLRIDLTTGVIGGAVARIVRRTVRSTERLQAAREAIDALEEIHEQAIASHSSGGLKRSRPIWATNRKQITSISRPRPRPAACRLPRRAKPLG